MKSNKIVFMFLCFVFYSCCGIDCEKQKQAEHLINKIETYRIENDRIPNSLIDLGFKLNEEDEVYFEKIDEDLYTIWYGTTLGDSNVYYSKSKVWTYD